MDTSEVIVEKVNSYDKSVEQVLHTDVNNDVQSTMENSSNVNNDFLNTTQNNSMEIQYTHNCETIVTNNIEDKQDYNGKDNTNELQQNSNEIVNISQNGISDNSNKNQNTSEDLTFGDLSQENDMCIVYEKNTDPFAQKSNAVSSLGNIALEYGSSDSETEDTNEQEKCDSNQREPLKEVQMQTYRQNKELSSSEESDSEDDSSDSSNSPVVSSESDSDDNSVKKKKDNEVKRHKTRKMRNELDELPPIEDLKISVPEVLCDQLGEIAWMVEQLVVVKPKPGKPALNLDTVLFVLRGQKALGKIYDVFGQVSEPHYCVRFNSSEHIKESDIKVGMTVYYCPNTEYTSLVFLHELVKIRGIDADIGEPPEFSDDEKERTYYEQLKAKQVNNVSQSDVPTKRKRVAKPTSGWRSNHPWNRNVQENRRNFPPIQPEMQLPNLWPQQYGYRSYPMQPSIPYIDQNFYGSQNYYNENNTTQPLLNPAIPFNAYPRVSSGYLPYQSHPNPFGNARFPDANMPWSSPVPQFSMRMRMPWESIPSPPPPPPLPPSSSSSGTT